MNPHAGFSSTRRSSLAASGRLLGVVAGVLLLGGCTVCRQTRRTMLEEPAQFSADKDRERTLATYRMWAESAWRRERGACSAFSASDEYSLGFRDGFVDYVYAGGTGEPPPVPPHKFWNVAWRTASGQAAAADWFAGYRHGAGVARDGGFRQQAVVLPSLGSITGHGLHPDLMPPDAIVGESMGTPPEDLGPPPPPEVEIGEPPSAPEGAAPSKRTLPAPQPAPTENDEADQTASRSAVAFQSMLRSAASRGGHSASPGASSRLKISPQMGALSLGVGTD